MEAISLLVGLAVLCIGIGGTAWLVVRSWRRRNSASPAAKVMSAIVALSAMFGALGTLIGLTKAFGAVGGESIDPSQKARILGEGISEAMNCTALGLAIWIPSAAITLLLLLQDGARKR